MKKVLVPLLSLFIAILLMFSTASAAEKQIVAGAGPSTTVVELFFSEFSQQPSARNYEFVIPPMSTKHAGGIANSDTFLFGRTGRPLNEAERARNKKEIFLAKVPISFATGDGSRISTLSVKEIEKIYRGEIGNWRELGGPDIDIITVGREPTEALFSELKEEYPFFREAQFDVVFKKDDEVVNFLKSPVGQYAIAFGAKPNFSETKPIQVTGGFNAGVRLGLVYDQVNENHPIVKASNDYAASDAWRKLVDQAMA